MSINTTGIGGVLGRRVVPKNNDQSVINSSVGAEAKLWIKHARGLPQAPVGYLFPVQAVAIAGQALMGESGWAGNEMRLGSIQYRPLPDLHASLFVEGSINETRQRYQGHFSVARLMLHELGVATGTTDEFTKDNWDHLQQAAMSVAEEWATATVRRNIVVSYLGRLAQAGAIQTVYRKKGGGEEPKPIPTAWWSLDDFTPRFRSCALDPMAPTKTSGALPAWFFLNEGALREVIAPSAESAPPTLLEGVHLSPYIRIIIEAARISGISPAGQIEKKHLFPIILPIANRFGLTLSQRDLEAMATFIREPESKKGTPTVRAQQNRDDLG